ncbi:MAG: hypothetical protein ABIR58_07475 [Gemmatimonadaceae bacterium]
MAEIRWNRISAALTERGHTVHMASAELSVRFRRSQTDQEGPAVVPLATVDWESYDMVKTLYHMGFETLERYGGARHPFIVAKLGSVVGPTDMEGIYFYGAQRERMFRVQQRIANTCGHVALLTRPAVDLWREMFGASPETLLVAGATDAVVPQPGRDPYPQDGTIRCVFSGNFYSRERTSQPEAHRSITSRLNRLGKLLAERGAQLFVVGPGDHRSLDASAVTYCGSVTHEASWDFLHFAAVGIVVAAGPFMHNNESTKIYQYLRAGLPVVSEAGFPNDNVIREAGLGFVVENNKPERMVDRIIEAAGASWDRDRATRYILSRHTWDRRAAVYDDLLSREPVERA